MSAPTILWFRQDLRLDDNPALLRAIELNAIAVEANKRAFHWGRRTAFDPEGIEQLARAQQPVLPQHRLSRDLDLSISWLVSYAVRRFLADPKIEIEIEGGESRSDRSDAA